MNLTGKQRWTLGGESAKMLAPPVTGHGVSPWEMTVLSFLSCPYVHLLCAPSVTHTLPRIRLWWSTECMAVKDMG